MTFGLVGPHKGTEHQVHRPWLFVRFLFQGYDWRAKKRATRIFSLGERAFMVDGQSHPCIQTSKKFYDGSCNIINGDKVCIGKGLVCSIDLTIINYY